jgi:hypothetical protein
MTASLDKWKPQNAKIHTHARAVASGGLGGLEFPQFLEEKLTLSQPGEQIMPTTVLQAPPDFQNLRRPAWCYRRMPVSTSECLGAPRLVAQMWRLIQSVYFLREVCLFFNFWMIKFTIMCFFDIHRWNFSTKVLYMSKNHNSFKKYTNWAKLSHFWRKGVFLTCRGL